MVEPLQKRRADGSLYRRRREVEEELRDLEELKLADVLAQTKAREQDGKTSISSEALVYILRREARRANTDSPGLDGLISILIQRSEKMVLRHLSKQFDEFQREEICNHAIFRVVEDICDKSDRADYAEVNFNEWLAHNRDDACRKHNRLATRTVRLGDAVKTLSDHDAKIVSGGMNEEASPEPTPEVAYAFREAHENAPLPPLIKASEFSPEDQCRIADMIKKVNLAPHILEVFLLRHFWEMAIESKVAGKYTLVKYFGKSEKTIRLWLGQAENAFTKLRGDTNGQEQNVPNGPKLCADRLPD